MAVFKPIANLKPLAPAAAAEESEPSILSGCGESNESEPLIPGLPDEIAELCLLHVPYPYQSLARAVSSSWNRAISRPLLRRSPSLSLPYLFAFAFRRSSSAIQCQAFDPRSRRWFLLPPPPLGCSAVSPAAFASAAAPSRGELYFLGGMLADTETPLGTTIIYRPSTNQWSAAAPMRTPRAFFLAGNVDGKIVAVGGCGPHGEQISTVESYDPEVDAWTAAAKMRAGLARYDAAVVGGELCVTEGWTWPFDLPPRGGVYDPRADTWREMSGGMKEGWTGVSVVLGDRLFVISELGDCPLKVYDRDEDTWRYVEGDRFPCAKVQRPFAVGAMEGNIYVVSSALNVAVGRVRQSGRVWVVEWEVVEAPKPFCDLCPTSCHVLYA